MIATRKRRDDRREQPPEPLIDVVGSDAYLRSAHGFLVDGADAREIGVVDDVELDPASGRVTRLHVCGGWFGRRRYLIAVEDVLAVYPSARRIVVSNEARRGGPA